MSVGFYAGSFDPFTKGHLAIVKKACKVFDYVVIGIGTNPNKTRRFDKEKMRRAIYEVLKEEGLYEKTEVYIYDHSMTVHAAQFYRANFLIRGIRNGVDYQYEESIASMNQELTGIDTVYFRAGEFGNISSSMVMTLLENGLDQKVKKYLPEPIFNLIQREYKKS